MYRPYTNHFPEVAAVAAQVVGATLFAAIWAHPLRTRVTTALLGVAIGSAAILPTLVPGLFTLPPTVKIFHLLQASATFATLAMLRERSRALKALAVLGQVGLFAVSWYVRESDFELIFAYLFWYGLLIGVYLLTAAPPRRSSLPPVGRSFTRHEVAIFVTTVALAFLVTNVVFKRLIYDGDEVAYTYQADVYGHFLAYGPVPPCPSMFENYWVFHYHGHSFSQYTPGWPLFMAPFSRLGLVDLAGPVIGGILAVGIARLSRRLASGLGSTPESSERIAAIAGVIGPLSAMLGPSMLLNAASRFSHTMVCACFAWAVESLCVVSDRGVTRRRATGYGLLLGSAAALCVATRPADGVFLGIGIFLYFVWAARDGRITWRAFAGTSIGFVAFAGLTLVILRLQLGAWFQTGYTISPSIHPEAALRLSWPRPHELKYGIPLAIGSYMWWPAAPALGIAGLIRALGGQERRVSFMLLLGPLALLSFYFFVEFDRYSDDGLGPRYFLIYVVPMATGGAALLAPLIERIAMGIEGPLRWMWRLAPAALVATAIVYGLARVAPLVYPLAVAEYKYTTAPFRGAKKLGLKNAIVMITPGHATAHETNLAQNPPLNPNPDVLFLIRRSKSDEVCARQNFPGRTWYRAGLDENLRPY
ncbi:MAG TPA: hypothetical protein VNW92_22495 [Polyangiaceae bacterium]|jgi:hypothetical protein|nr:hypothetical protein [Polyangiaceae bacterium]